MKGLDEKVVKGGEPWSRTRVAFSILLSQWGNAAYLASSHVGGQYVSRDHRAEKPEADKDEDSKVRTAHKGVKDTDEIVTGALGEPIPGAVADTTDGDR